MEAIVGVWSVELKFLFTGVLSGLVGVYRVLIMMKIGALRLVDYFVGGAILWRLRGSPQTVHFVI